MVGVDAESTARLEALGDVGRTARLDDGLWSRAALTVGRDDHHHLGARVDLAQDGRAARERLVVGVGREHERAPGRGARGDVDRGGGHHPPVQRADAPPACARRTSTSRASRARRAPARARPSHAWCRAIRSVHAPRPRPAGSDRDRRAPRCARPIRPGAGDRPRCRRRPVPRVGRRPGARWSGFPMPRLRARPGRTTRTPTA